VEQQKFKVGNWQLFACSEPKAILSCASSQEVKINSKEATGISLFKIT
jgi:hypothetical protein